MAPAVSSQLLWFALAIGLGGVLGLLYDFLRALRRRVPFLTALADLFFLLTAFLSLVAMGLYLCGGDLRLFLLPGCAVGMAAYFFLLHRLLYPLFAVFWRMIYKFFQLCLGLSVLPQKNFPKLQNSSFLLGKNGVQ